MAGEDVGLGLVLGPVVGALLRRTPLLGTLEIQVNIHCALCLVQKTYNHHNLVDSAEQLLLSAGRPPIRQPGDAPMFGHSDAEEVCYDAMSHVTCRHW